MATSYPGSLDSFPTVASTDAMDATGKEGDVLITNLGDSVEAIQGELGTDPAGSFTTVKARLDAYDEQPINAQTGTTYTPVAGDMNKLVTLSNTGAITVTLPQDSSLTFAVGKRIDFLVINTGMVTFAAGTGATVNGTPSLVSRAQWSAVTAIKRAANTWVVVGDLA